MTASPPARQYTRDDVLDQAEAALADAVDAYLTLSEPDWLDPGSTRNAETDLNADRRSTTVDPPAGANLDVIDYLALADRELGQLAGEVLGRLGAYADTPGEWRGPLAAVDTAEAARILRENLPTLPDELAAEVCAAVWRLANKARRLLNGGPPILRNLDQRRRCAACGRRSVIPHPLEPAMWVCATRSCAHRDPSPSHE